MYATMGVPASIAGFQAGVPSIIVPFALDQHAWAQRSYDLGIGSKPLLFKNSMPCASPRRLPSGLKYAKERKLPAGS
jgi:sterol 3beta-glucosyltransferase